MAWLNKRNGNYYYRSRREGDKVISEYVGSGYAAELFARLDEIERHKRQTEREAFKREAAEQDAIDSEIDDVCDAVNDLVDAVMLASGYHTHKRQWRLRREKQS